jgi:hypothetical protein
MDLTDLSTSADWGLGGTNVTNCESTWNGASNSNSMIAAGAAAGTAAKLCDLSTNGSKTDWYLPAIDELRFIWENRFLINLNENVLGYSPLQYFYYYWSSTEVDDTTAWNMWLANGVPTPLTKSNTISVRAVRKFTN